MRQKAGADTSVASASALSLNMTAGFSSSFTILATVPPHPHPPHHFYLD